MTGRIICLGDIMVDILATLPGPLAPSSDTPAPINIKQGGSAANTAVWLTHCGVHSVFVGKVGADSIGRDAVDQLAAQGVAVQVAIDPSTTTGICIVLVSPDGERTMVPSAGRKRHAVGRRPARQPARQGRPVACVCLRSAQSRITRRCARDDAASFPRPGANLRRRGVRGSDQANRARPVSPLDTVCCVGHRQRR